MAESKLVQQRFKPDKSRVFFDFDNTITTIDVLDDLIQRFSINDQWVALQEAWQNEEIDSKECLIGQLKGVRISPSDLKEYLRTAKLDSNFVSFLNWLRAQGIEPVILSDNFGAIIETILDLQGVKGLKVYANQLTMKDDCLIPSFPYENSSCKTCAHCKKTNFYKEDPDVTKKIIYVGDGRSDICAALASDMVFAKDTLLRYFRKHHHPCLEFSNLGDVHQHLKEEFHGAVVTA